LLVLGVVGLFEKIQEFLWNSFLCDLVIEAAELIADPFLTQFA
tara:strand:+ start:1343 stop:1471 length:129 start_codon:yes stop_codon:yes gene_type:complete